MWSEQVNHSVERKRVSATQQGFTLMELMTVVVIVGVLSAIAIPSFSSYIYKSRTAEANEFLGIIRLREESYRSEFGEYCHTMPTGVTPTSLSSLETAANFIPNPTTTPRDPKAFNATQQWLQLGARPTGAVRYGYGVLAGDPSTAVALGLGWTPATADFWFVARAVGDLNGDGTYGTFEIYSPTKNVFFGGSDRIPIAKGWE